MQPQGGRAACIGAPAPPRIARARAPPLWEMVDPGLGVNDARTAAFDPQAQSVPTYEFDQRIAW